MLQRFPGRTLEELDGVDYRRLMQAMAAQGILEVEGRRQLLIDGVIKELTDKEAERIAYHDELVGATAGDAASEEA